MKRKIEHVLGHDPWEWQIEYYVERFDIDRDDARAITIRQYMEQSDLGPLRAALAKATPIDDKTVALDTHVIINLIDLIDQDRLVVKRARARAGLPGKPKSPRKFARDFAGALRYLKLPEKSRTDAARGEIAREVGTTKDALKEAVTWLNKARKEWPKPTRTNP